MFDEGVKLVEASKALRVSRERVRAWWVEAHGEDGIRARKKKAQSGMRSRLKGAELDRARAAAVAAFHGEQSLKDVGQQVGVHLTVVRRWWKDEYGETLMKQRSKNLQRAKTTANNKVRTGPRRLEEVDALCAGCGDVFQANRMSIARSPRLLCSECKGDNRAPDQECSVCGFDCVGARGLASHVRHRCEAGDEAHRLWKAAQEALRWAGKVEDEDYVRCRECGFLGETLATHIKSHGLAADAYRKKYKGALLRARALTKRRSVAQAEAWERAPRKGAKKQIDCPDCGLVHEVSMFLAVEVHETRCGECLAAYELERVEARWAGKSEPEDYVTCLLCGHRAENLSSHLQNVHKNADYNSLPNARISALRAAQRIPFNKLSLSAKDLSPFMDDQGRVIVAMAAEELGCSQLSVRIYCRQLGLPTRNRLAFQKRVLDHVAGVLSGLAYEWEYTDSAIRNPETNYLLRYDGYFPLVNLLVEAHGRQHDQFVPYWHKTEEAFERRVRIDLLKLRRAREEGYAVLVIRDSDPEWSDEERLRRRLLDLGVAVPGES